MLIFSALAYSVGGVFMKTSEGLSRPSPLILASVIILCGVVAQTSAMRNMELSVAYMAVLGLEVILAMLFGIWFFEEKSSAIKLSGAVLVCIGIVLLNR